MSNAKSPIYKIGMCGLHIIETVPGKFVYVGSMPKQLLIPYKDHLGLPGFKSPVFSSYEDAYNNAKQVLEF